MSPVERLQAAIERLETLKSETGYFEQNGWLCEETSGDIARDTDEHGIAPLTNDELIVTLHRTIDAQLTWLRDQLGRAQVDQNQQGIPLHYRHSLVLADAILGDPA